MRSLQAPDDDRVDVYDCIVRRRKLTEVRRLLTTVRPEVLSAYARYTESDAEQLVHLAPLAVAAPVLKALRENYVTLRDREGGLYDRLRLSTPVCPLCGERDPTTVDHTLPRKTWAEFSILPENLVPACGACNHEKRELVVDEAGQPLFFNPYKDDLTGIEFLDATVETSSGVAIVQFFIRTEGADDQLLARLRRHFLKLKLGELYRVKAIPEIFEKTLLVREMHDKHVEIDEIQAALDAQARRTEASVGPNHWRSVLHRRLAKNDDFVAGACTPTLDRAL